MIALATSFGEAGISNWPCRSVRAALYLARRRRWANRRDVGRFNEPMFIHDPAAPAVLDPDGSRLVARLAAFDPKQSK